MIPRTMLSAAAALVVAGLAAGLSQATAPGKNGQIAFNRYELHDTPLTAHIVVANSDGSGQRTITHASRQYVDEEPDWAPDGSRIVFQALRIQLPLRDLDRPARRAESEAAQPSLSSRHSHMP